MTERQIKMKAGFVREALRRQRAEAFKGKGPRYDKAVADWKHAVAQYQLAVCGEVRIAM